jgi:hypothetical protein
VLDPTAGEGRLLKYAEELGASQVMGVELDSALAQYAGARQGNFLDVPVKDMQADVLLMNPPFTTGGPDTAKIVGKAITQHWTGKGKAALILPAGPSGEKVLAPYKHMVTHQEDLDAGAFKKEGTKVRSRLYILEKRAVPGRASAEDRKEAFDERQERRKERYESLADKRRADAKAAHDRAHSVSERFAAGQPILVGHHSEKRARSDRKKMDQAMRSGIEAGKKAEYHQSRAAAVGSGGISSDDPTAVTQLTDKLAELERTRDKMKRSNRAYRKEGVPGFAREAGISEATAQKIIDRLPEYDNDQPFAKFELTNLGANIRRVKKRIEGLRKEEVTREFAAAPELSGDGWSISEDADDNRVRIHFDGKPSADVRTKLKRAGFRWSRANTAWQRQLNDAGRNSARRVIRDVYGDDVIKASRWLDDLLEYRIPLVIRR